MALVREFVPSQSETRALHPTSVTCGWMAFTAGHRRLLQLDTYGSDQRQIHGKVTQTLQLDETAARRLLELIESAFPGIRG